MIIKSFEILRNPSKLNNIGIFILYGENIGLKKDNNGYISFYTKKPIPYILDIIDIVSSVYHIIEIDYKDFKQN